MQVGGVSGTLDQHLRRARDRAARAETGNRGLEQRHAGGERLGEARLLLQEHAAYVLGARDEFDWQGRNGDRNATVRPVL